MTREQAQSIADIYGLAVHHLVSGAWVTNPAGAPTDDVVTPSMVDIPGEDGAHGLGDNSPREYATPQGLAKL